MRNYRHTVLVSGSSMLMLELTAERFHGMVYDIRFLGNNALCTLVFPKAKFRKEFLELWRARREAAKAESEEGSHTL